VSKPACTHKSATPCLANINSTCGKRRSDLNLWPEDLGTGSVVLLSGRDDLMNARQVQEMLTRCGHIRVHYNQELTHGEFLLRSEVKRAIMEEVRGMLARSGSAVVGLARPVLETTMTLARNVVQLGGAGGHGRVRMHIARGGSKYVIQHTCTQTSCAAQSPMHACAWACTLSKRPAVPSHALPCATLCCTLLPPAYQVCGGPGHSPCTHIHWQLDGNAADCVLCLRQC
jgi:hypothetical protein